MTFELVLRSNSFIRKNILFLSLLFIISCSKKEIDVSIDTFSGEYEWYYSFEEIGDSEAFDTLEAKYGIRIEPNGKLGIYKDGKKIWRKEIQSSRIIYNGNIRTIVSKNDKTVSFQIDGSILTTNHLPVNGSKNYYIKTQ